MKKILIPTKLDDVVARTLKDSGKYSVVHDAQTPFERLIEQHPDTYALIVRSERVDAEVIDKLPQLKAVVRAGAGYDTIDINHARSRDIDVLNTPGTNSNAVAEEVLALVLADMRHVIPADASTRAGKWEKKSFMGTELTGKTVGIVGLGHIGRLVARRLQGFECTVLGYDPMVPSKRVKDAGIVPVSLEDIFKNSDVVTLHIPETDSTRKMIDYSLLSLMKPGARLVNCARAGIVDEDAIRLVKSEKQIRFLNDVYPKDEAGQKSVADIADIMMPHLGASTHEANFAAAKMAADVLIELDERGTTSYIVNRDIPEGLDKAYCDLAFACGRIARVLSGSAAPIKMIETSFYGNLNPYGDWLLCSILTSLWDSFDCRSDRQAAVKALAKMGIDYVNRVVDDNKGYHDSITIDLIVEDGNHRLKRTSIRGTMAESRLMIARINEFDRLYFEPSGAMLFCLYSDRPGMVAAVSRRLADIGMNIEDIRNPLNHQTRQSLLIFKLNRPIPNEVVGELCREHKSFYAAGITLD